MTKIVFVEPDSSKFTGKPGVIYAVLNLITRMVYIGQAVMYRPDGKLHAEKGRWKEHKYNAKVKKNYCPYLERSIRAHGPENFKVVVIHECDISELNHFEEFFIAKYSVI